MGKYDLPAQIEYVLRFTNSKDLTYIAHSQGTTQAFAGFSKNQELQSKVNLFIALAPATCITHNKLISLGAWLKLPQILYKFGWYCTFTMN